MGVAVYNYVVKDEIIDKILESDIGLDDLVPSQFIDVAYVHPQADGNQVVYCHGSKAWLPMYGLLKLLDKSESKALSKIHNETFSIGISENNDPLYCYHSYVVKEIWTELRRISIGTIEDAIDDREIMRQVSLSKGYWNENIVDKTAVGMEFFELYKAFYEAQKRRHGVILSFG